MCDLRTQDQDKSRSRSFAPLTPSTLTRSRGPKLAALRMARPEEGPVFVLAEGVPAYVG